MVRAPLGRLISACLILLFSSGGGRLPLVDGLVFHDRDRGAEVSGSHFESTSACHADGCSIRSTAQPARFAPALLPDAWRSLSPETRFSDLSFPAPLAESLSGRPLSRAPPLFA